MSKEKLFYTTLVFISIFSIIAAILVIYPFNKKLIGEALGVSTSTIVLNPIEDTHVRMEQPNTVYGNELNLRSSRNTSTPSEYISYLKFDLSSLNSRKISKVEFILNVTTSTNFIRHFAEVDTGWSEATLNYNNRPSYGKSLGSLDLKSRTGEIRTSVGYHFGNAVLDKQGQQFAFAIYGVDGATNLIFGSSESPNPPRLEIEYVNTDALEAANTFTPSKISDNEEIVNPMRGLHRWNDQESAPQPIPLVRLL